MHENACKGLHEGTGRFFKNVDLERQSPLDVFLRDKTIFNFFFFFFFDRVAWRHVCNTRTCAQKMSCFHVFPGKGRPFISCPGKKYHIFGKKIASFQIIQESSYAGAAPFRKAIFSEILKKYFFVFF